MSTTILTDEEINAQSLSSLGKLTKAYSRINLLEFFRTPIAIVGNVAMPAMAMLFFVVPQREVAEDPALAASAVLQLLAFVAMTVPLFGFGASTAEERARPFHTFVRSLPAPAWPRMLASAINALLFTVLSVIPLLIIGWVATSASIELARIPAVAVVLLISLLMWSFLGLAIGYAMSQKAALAVTQLGMFAFAFGGGMFIPAEFFPGWLDNFSLFLPSRAARDLTLDAGAGASVDAVTVIGFALWMAVAALLALWAIRSDEGRRYR